MVAESGWLTSASHAPALIYSGGIDECGSAWPPAPAAGQGPDRRPPGLAVRQAVMGAGLVQRARDALDSPAGVTALLRSRLDPAEVDTVIATLASWSAKPAPDARVARAANLPPETVHATRRLLDAVGLHPGRSWAPPAPDGAHARLPVWHGHHLWLADVQATLTTSHATAVLRRHHTCAATVLRVARVEAAAADGPTGRDVLTSHQTVAHRARCSVDVCRRARRVLSDLGLAVTITVGGWLTTEQRTQATAVHGGDQTRVASRRCLIHPGNRPSPRARRIAKASWAPLPDRRSGQSVRQDSTGLPTRAKRRATAHEQPRWTIATMRLGAQLLRLHPNLLNGGHAGGLYTVLARLQLDSTKWSGADLVDAIEAHNRTRNLTQPGCRTFPIRRPLGLLITQIRAVLADWIGDPPVIRRRREQEARLTERRAWRAQMDQWTAQRAQPRPVGSRWAAFVASQGASSTDDLRRRWKSDRQPQPFGRDDLRHDPAILDPGNQPDPGPVVPCPPRLDPSQPHPVDQDLHMPTATTVVTTRDPGLERPEHRPGPTRHARSLASSPGPAGIPGPTKPDPSWLRV